MRRRFALPLLLLGLLTLPVAADPRPDVLYTTHKEFVQISPPRQLTFNANTSQFAYDPLGLEVAVTGTEIQQGQATSFVKTLDVRTGKELHRLTMSAPPDTETTDTWFRILGWTPSGKYLLLEQTKPKEDGAGEGNTNLVRWDLGTDPPKLRPVKTLPVLPEGAQVDAAFRFTSPQCRRVLVDYIYSLNGKQHSAYQVYDAEQDTSRTLAPLDGQELSTSWADDSHLRLVLSSSNRKQQQIDVITGQISPLSLLNVDQAVTSRQFPDLNLTVDRKVQTDYTSSGGFDSSRLWVRCAARWKQPFSVVGAGLVMGSDEIQAVWSPPGKQIAFLNNADLYVVEVAIVPSEEMAEERLTLGLPLTCKEERAIASSHMKQIGLAITQYTQDFDETLPPAADVDETIYPYLKNRSLYNVGKIHWAYHAPGNLSLAALDAPADTVLGTMDLPCGQVVLYADGHVKESPKAAP